MPDITLLFQPVQVILQWLLSKEWEACSEARGGEYAGTRAQPPTHSRSSRDSQSSVNHPHRPHPRRCSVALCGSLPSAASLGFSLFHVSLDLCRSSLFPSVSCYPHSQTRGAASLSLLSPQDGPSGTSPLLTSWEML